MVLYSILFDPSDISTRLMTLQKILDLGWFIGSSILLGSRSDWPCQKVWLLVGEFTQEKV